AVVLVDHVAVVGHLGTRQEQRGVELGRRALVEQLARLPAQLRALADERAEPRLEVADLRDGRPHLDMPRREVERECRSLARLRRDTDLAAQQPGDLAADREPEPG